MNDDFRQLAGSTEVGKNETFLYAKAIHTRKMSLKIRHKSTHFIRFKRVNNHRWPFLVFFLIIHKSSFILTKLINYFFLFVAYIW